MLIKIIELNWFELIAFTSVLLGTPGPATISLLYSGINYGFKKSLPYFLGIIIGFFCNLLIAAFGISAILEYQLIYNILKYTVLLYILYLAYKIATSTPFVENTESKPLLFSQGLLLNLLNPKAYIAVVSILSQFSVVNEYWYSVFYIIIINLSIALLSHGLWCFAGQSIAKIFRHPKWYRVINYSLAIVLILSILLVYMRDIV